MSTDAFDIIMMGSYISYEEIIKTHFKILSKPLNFFL